MCVSLFSQTLVGGCSFNNTATQGLVGGSGLMLHLFLFKSAPVGLIHERLFSKGQVQFPFLFFLFLNSITITESLFGSMQVTLEIGETRTLVKREHFASGKSMVLLITSQIHCPGRTGSASCDQSKNKPDPGNVLNQVASVDGSFTQSVH